ncbi:zinc finger protein 239-like isoform X1 [Rhagoletis pomonella]|uniref:zinc finger protein 239-like isoform X1 n=1 Tax=Rhagoletis pomonella TaxID=28610 RepID=UPI001782E87D|nr:zinc finger protein 239-like isoform X1 [Rhagoletis pomonella]
MMQSTKSETALQESSTEYVDLSDYCRLCLQVPEESQLLDLQLIYDEEENLSYYDCFTVCTQIDLHAGGVNAPHQLCKSCGLELQVAYDFHKKVEESKKFLMQLNKTEQLDEEFLSTSPPIAKERYENSDVTTPMQIESNIQTVTEDVVEQAEDKTNDRQLILALHVNDAANENEIANSQEIIAGHLATPIEYEALEEHIEMEDYQSVDELVDEDAETVQIQIDDQEYLLQKVKLNEKNFTDGLIDAASNKSPDVSSKKPSEIKSTSEESNSEFQSDNITFDYESTESDIELVNDKQNEEHIIEKESPTKKKNTESNVEIDVKSLVISKKGEIRERRRYSGKFTCDYCQKVFKNRSRMLTHRRSHEPDRPKFECEECGRLYATKQAKLVHVRTFHNRIGHKCPICGKIYVIGKLLEVHMRFHTGDFPYVCDICGQKFAQMCHLNTHKNVKHNSVRYSCEHPGCGKFFTSSSSLRNHEFSHTSMPFECAHCKRGYPAKSKLKVHIRQKHGIEVTLEQLEDMRKFHVMRSRLNLVKITE